MTDVLARARELVKQTSMGSIPVNLGEISGQINSSISQAVAAGYQAQRDGDPATDSILIHYRDVDRRHESFCQHGGWKLQSPSAQDLAEAGFFYAPLPGSDDRVACYACGKVLFNWDPNDEIADAHKLFAPNCPLVTGKPVEIPSAVKKPTPAPAKPWEVAKDTEKGAFSKGAMNANGHLSSFINSIRQGAAAAVVAEGEEEVLPLPKGAKGGGKKKAKGKHETLDFPAASMSDGATTDNNTGSDTDGPDPTVNAAAAAAAGRKAMATTEPSKRADRLWKFDWSVPSVVKTGLRGEGALLDAAAGELEMRLNTAKSLMQAQRDDWEAAGLRAEAACRQLEQRVNEQMDTARIRVEVLREKAARIAAASSKLRDDDVLRQRANKLEQVRSEHERVEQEVAAGHQLLLDLKSKTDAERADLELIKNKDRLLTDLSAKIKEQEKRSAQLVGAAEAAEERAAVARNDKEQMQLEMCKVRDELKDEISEQYQSKLTLETSLTEMTEQMLRVKKLYTEYKGRVKEMTERELLITSREAEMRTREEQVSRRDATLKTREEWISKREAQFRIQQRALENAQLMPRGSLISASSSTASAPPPNLQLLAAHTPGSAASGEGTPRGMWADGQNPGGGLADAYYLSDEGGSGSAAGSGGGGGMHSLADQVMHAQATYSLRTNAGMESAVAHRGKMGVKEAAHRDYKAILSTSDKSDPKEDRDMAKAARRRDMIKSFIPSKLRKAAAAATSSKQSRSAAPANSAASSLDMNNI